MDVQTLLPPSASRKRFYLLAGGLIVLLALSLRLPGLGAESFWYDEGISIGLASGTIAGLFASPEAPMPPTIHPPVYYLSLMAWIRAAGCSEFAARYLSLLFGVVSVAAAMPLARRLAASPRGIGACLALVASFLMAVSPFFVRYSQEARMYALVTLLVLLSSLAAHSAATRGRGYLAYALLSALALYTHYFAALVIGGQNLTVLGYLAFRHRRAVGRWLRWQGVWALLYLPWLAYMAVYLRGAGDFWRQRYPLSFIVGHTISIFSLGETGPPQTWALALFWGVAALGLIGLLRRSLRWPALISLLTLALAFLGTLLSPAAVYTPRYLMVVAPAHVLLLAVGVVNIATLATWGGRRMASLAPLALALACVLMLGLTAASAQALDHYYGSEVRREDYRGLAAFLAPHVAPGDHFVFSTGRMDHAFFHYLGDTHPYVALSQRERFAAASPLPELAQAMQDEATSRIWLIESLVSSRLLNDPDGIVPARLGRDFGVMTLTKRVSGLQARLYSREAGMSFEAICLRQSVDNRYGEAIELKGYGLQGELEPGGIMKVALAWQAVDAVGEDYWVSVQLADERNALITIADYPLGNLAPSSTWELGDRVLDRAVLRLPPQLDAEFYCLKVILYEPGSGRVLPMHDQSGAATGPIVHRWPKAITPW